MLSPVVVGSQRYVGQLWATNSFNYQGKNGISSARRRRELPRMRS
jgi:hypothetical protein